MRREVGVVRFEPGGGRAYADSTGKLIHDPDERTKRVKRLVSDIEYRKLHVGKA